MLSNLRTLPALRMLQVPADEKEALTSDLMGLFEKRRFKNFLVFVQVKFWTNSYLHNQCGKACNQLGSFQLLNETFRTSARRTPRPGRTWTPRQPPWRRSTRYLESPLTSKSDCCLFQKFGLDENTSDFVGHALALFRSLNTLSTQTQIKLETWSCVILRFI